MKSLAKLQIVAFSCLQEACSNKDKCCTEVQKNTLCSSKMDGVSHYQDAKFVYNNNKIK